MKTSIGIWAFGPMVTRFVPAGYQPEHGYEPEPVAEKVHRAVEGLGDLMDGYEFHYPNELSPDNLDDVRAALGSDHDIYCIAGGLHLDPRFGRGGLVNPDEKLRAEARRIVREAAEFAGSLGVHLIIWPGGEGYNYPFQTPYAASWGWLIDGLGEAASVCASHGVKLFLEHKNSEPAMKILMRNIGMCLHVVHKLRAEGITNVQINMDWQHLIMNGEHLAEYAALLASENLLGHQHGNSGWGTFDDDNMVGASRGRIPALNAEAGVGGAGPRALVARHRIGSRRAAARGGSAGRPRVERTDARPRRARLRRPRAAPRDPLERPADGRGVRVH